MAITGAITLGHLATISQNPLEKFVIMNLLRYSELLTHLPFRNVDSLVNVSVRWTALPTPAFRKFNAGYTASVGDTEQVWESVYPAGGEFNIDRLVSKVKNMIIDPVQNQIEMHLKAMALTMNDYLINGDHAVDPDTFEGIKKRVDGMPSRQTIYFTGSSSAPLDPTSSAANARKWLDKLEECMYKCNSGNANLILANEGTKWGFGRVMRYLQLSGNFLDSTKDVMGREILSYKGIPIIDSGLKRDQTTEVITGSEVAGDGGTDSTSIYFVSTDRQEGAYGIQLAPLEVYDPLKGGEKEATPTEMVRYEWGLGLSSPGSRGITRGRNFETAGDWT